jgi:hypothetical protein
MDMDMDMDIAAMVEGDAKEEYLPTIPSMNSLRLATRNMALFLTETGREKGFYYIILVEAQLTHPHGASVP